VLPTCDRPASLRSCLGALSAVRGSWTIPVVVVDDGSGEPAKPGHHDHLEITILRTGELGPAAARNVGARAASTELIAFIDDDCEPRPDWLERLVGGVAGGAAAVGGRTASLEPGLFATASQALLDVMADAVNEPPGSATFVTANNLLVRREAFLSIGGFDERFRLAAGEDRDLAERLVAAGYAVSFDPEVTVLHRHPRDARRYLSQNIRYGRGALALVRARRARAMRRPGRGRLRLLAALLSRPVRAQGLRGLPASAVVAAGQAAHVVGFLAEAAARPHARGRGRERG